MEDTLVLAYPDNQVPPQLMQRRDMLIKSRVISYDLKSTLVVFAQNVRSVGAYRAVKVTFLVIHF
jgi:hypothetical protein